MIGPEVIWPPQSACQPHWPKLVLLELTYTHTSPSDDLLFEKTTIEVAKSQ